MRILFLNSGEWPMASATALVAYEKKQKEQWKNLSIDLTDCYRDNWKSRKTVPPEDCSLRILNYA